MTTSEATTDAPKFAERTTADASLSRNRRRTGARWMRRGALGFTVAGIAAAVALAFVPQPATVDVGRVVRGPMTVTVNEEGRSRVKDRYVVTAPLGGDLDRIVVRVGADVDRGQTIASLAPTVPALLDDRARDEAEARLRASLAAERRAALQVERAETAAAQASVDLERAKALHVKGALPPAELEKSTLNERIAGADLQSARFGVRVASYEVEMARAASKRIERRAAREHFDVPSPITGRVFRVLRESAGPAAAGTPLMELAEPAALEVVIDVLTSDAVRISPGAKVVLTRWGGGDLAGHVRLVEPSAFTRVNALGVEEQRANVVVDFDDPPEAWKSLGDGYRVEARIGVWQRPDVVQVPESAAFRRGDGWAVYRVDAGRARLVPVQLGERTTVMAEVLSGLGAGDVVIVHPGDAVKDGARVEVR